MKSYKVLKTYRSTPWREGLIPLDSILSFCTHIPAEDETKASAKFDEIVSEQVMYDQDDWEVVLITVEED